MLPYRDLLPIGRGVTIAYHIHNLSEVLSIIIIILLQEAIVLLCAGESLRALSFIPLCILFVLESISINFQLHIDISLRSGGHDMIIPNMGTREWIRTVNFSIVDDWRL